MTEAGPIDRTRTAGRGGLHVLLVADGRSPHTVGWLRGMAGLGLTTTLLSSRLLGAADLAELAAVPGPPAIYQPRDLWNTARVRMTPGTPLRRLIGRGSLPAAPAPAGTRGLGSAAAIRLELYAARRLSARLAAIVRTVQPDVVHALRIQYEAIAAAGARLPLPLAVSTWGQDLVLTAASDPLLGRRSRAALSRADVLFSDCQRDADLAGEWGLRPGTPTFVVPGNYGLDLAAMPPSRPDTGARWGLRGGPLVTYPRGLRSFVNHRGFVAAVRRLLTEGVDAVFLAVGLAGVVGPQSTVPGVFAATEALARASMLEVAAASAVTVSPAWSDGTPNSVLEGMAAGSIPVCGRLDPLRELEQRGAVIAWCDPSDVDSIAAGIRTALRLSVDPVNRERNRTTVAAYYSTDANARRARTAYETLATAR